MKLHLLLILILVFSLSVFGQTDDGADIPIQQLSLAKKSELSKLLQDIAVAVDVYANSTDHDLIANECVGTIAKIRKYTATMPKSFVKNNLIAGAGAWEKAFLFRYEKMTGQQIPPARRKEIITVYKLQDIAPDDRADKLFDYAQAFFNIAADVAVASGVPTN